MRQNARLKVLRIRDGSLLDADSKARIAANAAEKRAGRCGWNAWTAAGRSGSSSRRAKSRTGSFSAITGTMDSLSKHPHRSRPGRGLDTLISSAGSLRGSSVLPSWRQGYDDLHRHSPNRTRYRRSGPARRHQGFGVRLDKARGTWGTPIPRQVRQREPGRAVGRTQRPGLLWPVALGGLHSELAATLQPTGVPQRLEVDVGLFPVCLGTPAARRNGPDVRTHSR